MAEIVNMPRLSDTMEEGVVAKWLKKVGDTVKEGDILAEIETDKATMEFESFYSGTLLYIGLKEGETAPVDTLLAIIGEKGEDISLIGGGIELNETEETTLKREALEEAGLEIIGMNKICDIDCYWKTRDNRDMESLTHIYQIEISDKIIEPLEVESKLVKMSINEAKNQLKLPYQKQGLTEFLNKIK